MTHAASCGVSRRAIWDGSKVSGAQVAVAPAGAGAIALQLVKANPARGEGALQGQRQVVRYQTDYIFWRAG
ncbi:MAG: hypothetical protein IPO43_18715 [Rhodoferax sp.]|nr:hypothetical protein [Rhodoferax sp.]